MHEVPARDQGLGRNRQDDAVHAQVYLGLQLLRRHLEDLLGELLALVPLLVRVHAGRAPREPLVAGRDEVPPHGGRLHDDALLLGELPLQDGRSADRRLPRDFQPRNEPAADLGGNRSRPAAVVVLASSRQARLAHAVVGVAAHLPIGLASRQVLDLRGDGLKGQLLHRAEGVHPLLHGRTEAARVAGDGDEHHGGAVASRGGAGRRARGLASSTGLRGGRWPAGARSRPHARAER